MQFKSSERKIYELNHQFRSIGYSKNTDQFEANFAAFIAAGRSVTMALQNDGGITFKDGKLNKEGDVPGFAQWYVGKQDEMRKDELCKYFKNIRDIDIHTGNTLIDSSYLLSGPVTLNAPKDGILEISGRGVYEVFGKNTPHELKVQKQLDGLENFQVHLQNIPKIHKGKDISDVSIVEFCSLYKKYLEELVLEAKIIFLDK